MSAKYILAVLSVIFLIAGASRLALDVKSHPQGRTWLLVGGIFGFVSAWLFYQT